MEDASLLLEIDGWRLTGRPLYMSCRNFWDVGASLPGLSQGSGDGAERGGSSDAFLAGVTGSAVAAAAVSPSAAAGR